MIAFCTIDKIIYIETRRLLFDYYTRNLHIFREIKIPLSKISKPRTFKVAPFTIPLTYPINPIPLRKVGYSKKSAIETSFHSPPSNEEEILSLV